MSKPTDETAPAPAPSQTAVEPVAELVERLEHLVSLNDPDKGGPYGGYAAQNCVEAMSKAASALSAQAAALVAAEKERDEALEAEEAAKDCFWAIYPKFCEAVGHGISPEAARTALSARAEAAEKIIRDAECAIYGRHERGFAMKPLIDAPSLADAVATLKARIAELEAGLAPFAKEADTIEQSYTTPLPDEYITPFAPKLGLFRRARSLSPQEQMSNG